MSRIELTGLPGDLPIGAMAAFGVLRICSRSAGISDAKLCWSGSDGDYRAALLTANEVSADDLVGALIEDVQGEPELPPWEQVKTIGAEDFHRETHDSARHGSATDHERADWMAALGSELATDDGNVVSTPFDMSVARQKFLLDAVRLAAALSSGKGGRAGSVKDDYKEALFGPWRYQDDQHSLGWDPTTMKFGAFTHKAPPGMANSGVRAAIWLAFESLPLFPCFYARGLQTRGFIQKGRDAELRWPIWRPPIDLHELATLLGWVALYQRGLSREELGARGVTAVYRAERFKPNKYMVTFRMPELV